MSDGWDSPVPANFETSSSFEAGGLCVRPLTENLDTIAFPDRECVFKYKHVFCGPIKHFIAGRGCPFDCTYCFNASYSALYKGKGRRVRWRSVDNVLAEIKEVIAKSPTQVVYFQDDTFITYRSWLREFAQKYEKEIGLPYHCHVRADLITGEIAGLLCDSGCNGVHLAIESGNEEVRKKLLKRPMSNWQILDAVYTHKDVGKIYNIMTQNILGLPDTTIEDDIKTLELNIECRPLYAWASIFHPYPRTQLGEYAKRSGLYTGDFSDLSNNFFDESPLNIPHANKVANLQKLFALAVEHPEIYHSGLLATLIDLPSVYVRQAFKKLYQRFRKQKDRELYGVDL